MFPLKTLARKGLTLLYQATTSATVDLLYIWSQRMQPIVNGNAFVPNTLTPRQNGCHFPDDIFKGIFLNGKVWVLIQISLKFVSRGPINNIPTLVQIMAWCRPNNKPLSEPLMVNFLRHVCVTRPQWVNHKSYHLVLRSLQVQWWLKLGSKMESLCFNLGNFAQEQLNSLARGRCESIFRSTWYIYIYAVTNFSLSLMAGWILWNRPIWMLLDLIYNKSTSPYEMVWCRHPTNHYLSQCWPRSMSLYAVTTPQWVNYTVTTD